MSRPKWLSEKTDSTTRKKSKKQETKIAKLLKGKMSINSGATLGQNDVISDFCEVECKTTSKESFSVTMKDWTKLVEKCDVSKIPMMAITLEGKGDFAVLQLKDLKYLIDVINNGTKETE